MNTRRSQTDSTRDGGATEALVFGTDVPGPDWLTYSRRKAMVVSRIFRAAFAASAGLLVAVALFAGAASKEGTKQMATRQIDVQRCSVISSKPFDDVVAGLEAKIGHPDMSTFRKEITAARTQAEMEQVVHSAIGPSGFMEFARYDLGEVLRKESGGKTPRILRLVVGNPLIMKQMVKSVPDAGSYAPVTILIDERADGVHLSYDTMASFLAPYGSPEALKVARDLDTKVEALLTAAAN
jgi:uncharacterized protein (DUF302 family)